MNTTVWPEDLVKRAEFEIDMFERPSIDTSKCLLARVIELEAQIKGPDEFETWKDAAIDERVRRVAAENRERELVAHSDRLKSLVKDVMESDSYFMTDWDKEARLAIEATPAESLELLKSQLLKSERETYRQLLERLARELNEWPTTEAQGKAVGLDGSWHFCGNKFVNPTVMGVEVIEQDDWLAEKRRQQKVNK